MIVTLRKKKGWLKFLLSNRKAILSHRVSTLSLLTIDYKAEMARIQAEMRDIISAEKKSQTMLEAVFRGIGYGID